MAYRWLCVSSVWAYRIRCFCMETLFRTYSFDQCQRKTRQNTTLVSIVGDKLKACTLHYSRCHTEFHQITYFSANEMPNTYAEPCHHSYETKISTMPSNLISDVGYQQVKLIKVALNFLYPSLMIHGIVEELGNAEKCWQQIDCKSLTSSTYMIFSQNNCII